MAETNDNNLTLSRKSVTSKVNPEKMPELTKSNPRYDYSPFSYQEGMSVKDILAQGKAYQESLTDQEERAKKMAKFTAWGDFFRSLGALAGGGYATPVEFKQNPYLTKSFALLDEIRNDRERGKLYYQQLADKERKDDYNRQYTAFWNQKKEYNRQAEHVADSDSKASNQAALEGYRNNTKTITETSEDPTLKEQQLAITRMNADTSRMNADTSRMNAENNKAKTDETNRKKNGDNIVAKINRADGSVMSITANQARMLVKRAQKDYEDKIKSPLIVTTQEKPIVDALVAADPQSIASLSKVASQLYKNPRYKDFYTTNRGSELPEQKNTGSLLPTSNNTSIKKPSLLP